MSDSLPSQEMALAYVRTVEQQWGMAPTVIISCELSEDGLAWVISTNNHNGPKLCWHVWQRADGRVYGEC